MHQVSCALTATPQTGKVMKKS